MCKGLDVGSGVCWRPLNRFSKWEEVDVVGVVGSEGM